MKTQYALFITVAVSILFQVSAKAQAEASNSQSRITPRVEIPSLKVNEPFLGARSKILRAGWHPMGMHTNKESEYFGTEKVLALRKFGEVDFCSMDAGVLCVLYYRKGTKCLRLGTVGEKPSYMKVTRWADECPVAEVAPRKTP